MVTDETSPQVTGIDISEQYKKFKPAGKLNQEEMMTLIASLAKLKKISVDWKNKLMDDDAWKIDCQQPSPGSGQKASDPKATPINKKKS